MEATTKVKIQSLDPYLHLFPKAKLTTTSLKKNATVFDTVNTVTDAVRLYSWQVKEFVDQELRGMPLYAACDKLWHWLKYHIEYARDPVGYETVKTPQRLISDGCGDCDDYCFFVNCCMAQLGVKGVVNRITKYTTASYQHIYPLVPIGRGKYIVVDCVVHAFNYEEPYTTKMDFEMELQMLDGIEPRMPAKPGIDAQDLFTDEAVDGLFKNIASSVKDAVQNVASTAQNVVQSVTNTAQNTAQNVSNAVQNAAQAVVDTVKDPSDLLHSVNQVNPAVALLRLGFLASMKLNIMAVASNIKWGYLSRADAEGRGIDPAKHDQIAKVLSKAEEIFYGAGGSKENLREAILTGDGNKNHEVAGLGNTYNRNQPLRVILGNKVYTQNAGSSLNGLGEPVSAAAIAAAASAMGALAALISQIGNIFKKEKTPEAAQPIVPNTVISPPRTATPLTQSRGNTDTDVSNMDFSSLDLNSINTTSPSSSTSSSSAPAYNTSSSAPSTSSYSNDSPSYLPQAKGDTDKDTGTYWDKNWKWIVPTGSVILLGTGTLIVYNIRKKKNGKNKNSAPVHGVPKKAKTKPKQGGKRKYPKIAAIQLQ